MASREPVRPAQEDGGRRRLQIELSPDAYNRLVDIRTKAGMSNTELIRNALRLYEWFLEVREDGFRIQLAKGDIVKDVEFLF